MYVVAVIYLAGAALGFITAAFIAVSVGILAMRDKSPGNEAPLLTVLHVLWVAAILAPLWPIGIVALVQAAFADYEARRQGLVLDF